MAVMRIYAGNSASSLVELPSPVSLKNTRNKIWSENTGRAQSGTNKAKMIGDVLARKKSFEIKWGILTATEVESIISHLDNKSFVYFAAATSPSAAQSSAKTYYSSDISYEIIQSGPNVFYKDATVSMIEQ